MNIIMKGKFVKITDPEFVFGDVDGNLPEHEQPHFSDADSLEHLMVEIGAYPSTSACRRAGRVGDVPEGFTEFKASKKMQVWIWNPTE